MFQGEAQCWRPLHCSESPKKKSTHSCYNIKYPIMALFIIHHNINRTTSDKHNKQQDKENKRKIKKPPLKKHNHKKKQKKQQYCICGVLQNIHKQESRIYNRIALLKHQSIISIYWWINVYISIFLCLHLYRPNQSPMTSTVWFLEMEIDVVVS